MTKLRALAAVSIVMSCAGLLAAQGSLGPAVRKAKRAADATRFSLELKRMSQALKPRSDEDDLDKLAQNGRDAVAKLRGESFSLEATSTLDKLDGVYAKLPQKSWAKDYAIDLAEIIAVVPGWAADEGGSVEDMDARIAEALASLPDAQPDSDGFLLKIFPEDVPLEKFKKINPIIVFLAKHRLKRPKKLAKTTPSDIVDGRHHVQVGVTVEGTVTWNTQGSEFDQDWCFNIGDLHLEITPEWRLTHRGFLKPKTGDKVRVSGWTYYDYFHKAEHEYRDDDPVLGAQRATLWEIHPVMDAQLIR